MASAQLPLNARYAMAWVIWFLSSRWIAGSFSVPACVRRMIPAPIDTLTDYFWLSWILSLDMSGFSDSNRLQRARALHLRAGGSPRVAQLAQLDEYRLRVRLLGQIGK